jgi:hypothetical protein
LPVEAKTSNRANGVVWPKNQWFLNDFIFTIWNIYWLFCIL